MSSASIARGRLAARARRASHILWLCAAVWPSLLLAPRAAAISSYLFATPEACAASRRFSRQNCADAFANALVELRERIANFSTRWKCQFKYRLCEKDGGAEEAWRPTLLGVEIVVGAGEPSATPILAVETPRGAFAALPISRSIEPVRRISAGFAPILPVGRFHAKSHSVASKSVEEGAETSFGTMIDVEEPPPRDDAAPSTHESSAARRRRLRAAPFVE